MAEEIGVSKVTFLKHFKKLEGLGLVKVTRRFGKSKLYTLNETNSFSKRFIELTLSLANYHAQTIIEKHSSVEARH